MSRRDFLKLSVLTTGVATGILRPERAAAAPESPSFTHRLSAEFVPVTVTTIPDHHPVTREQRAEQLKTRQAIKPYKRTTESVAAQEESPVQEVEFELQKVFFSDVEKGEHIDGNETYFIKNSNFPDSFRGDYKNSLGIQHLAKVPEGFMFQDSLITTAFTYEGGIILVEGDLESGEAVGHFLRLKNSGSVFDVCELMPNGDIFFGDNFVEGMFFYNHHDHSVNQVKGQFEEYYQGLRGLDWITPAEDGLYATKGNEILLHIDLSGETPGINGWLTAQKSLRPRDTIEAVIGAAEGNRVMLLMKEYSSAEDASAIRAIELTAEGTSLSYNYLVVGNPLMSVVEPVGYFSPDALRAAAAHYGESEPCIKLRDHVSFAAFNPATAELESPVYVKGAHGMQLEIEDLDVRDVVAYTAHSSGMNAYAIIYPDGRQVVAESRQDPNNQNEQVYQEQAANGYAHTICITPDGKLKVGHGPLEGQFKDAMMTVVVPKQQSEHKLYAPAVVN